MAFFSATYKSLSVPGNWVGKAKTFSSPVTGQVFARGERFDGELEGNCEAIVVVV